MYLEEYFSARAFLMFYVKSFYMSQLWLECCYLGCRGRVHTKRIEEMPACSLAAPANSCLVRGHMKHFYSQGFTVTENIFLSFLI